jgi:hypothetical protein
LTALRRVPPVVLYFALAIIAGLVYLAASRAGGFVGFPLDDAWIHQTYARNLASTGEFAFVAGQPSAGSTSPLWTALLAVGYLLRIDYHLWAYSLGVGLLAVNAWLVHRLVLRWWPFATPAAIAAGLFIVLEWHLVWAAVSGMETLLFCAGVLLVLVLPVPAFAGVAGFVTGLAVLARPDAIILLPFLLARIVLKRKSGKPADAIGPPVVALLGFATVFVPYLLFNRALSGSVWPNTFYAKQAEYAILVKAPLLYRLAAAGMLPFVGAQVLLLPGIAAAIWRGWRERHWELLLAAGWCLVFAGAYAVRLPVVYQHGRYLIPTIPVWIALGAGGVFALLRLSAASWLPRVVSRVWLAALAMLGIVFWGQGAIAYQHDVQFIESEMVATAHWVNANTPTGALVAAHDIGALGYFGGRRLLDLAGLVSPEVVPFIRDEARLRQWLNVRRADYLVTFPGWYPSLAAAPESHLVFTTAAPYGPSQGGENISIYQWQPAAAGRGLP